MVAYRLALLGIAVAAVLTTAVLFLRSAPYGRHSRAGWGPRLRSRTAWIVMELPAVLVVAAMALRPASPSGVSLLFLALWETHYLYRTFVYPALMRSSPRTFPVVLVAAAWLFNGANGYVNGWRLFRADRIYPIEWLADPRFIVGCLLFAGGFAVHLWSDTILRKLRHRGESSYRVPTGGLFELVSAPNYLGEIVQWFGWALASWSLAGLSFAVFTAANLLPRALSHHAWYRRTFPDYPEGRKALIPGLL